MGDAFQHTQELTGSDYLSLPETLNLDEKQLKPFAYRGHN
jgi:hypothetical protein